MAFFPHKFFSDLASKDLFLIASGKAPRLRCFGGARALVVPCRCCCSSAVPSLEVAVRDPLRASAAPPQEVRGGDGVGVMALIGCAAVARATRRPGLAKERVRVERTTEWLQGAEEEGEVGDAPSGARGGGG